MEHPSITLSTARCCFTSCFSNCHRPYRVQITCINLLVFSLLNQFQFWFKFHNKYNIRVEFRIERDSLNSPQVFSNFYFLFVKFWWIRSTEEGTVRSDKNRRSSTSITTYSCSTPCHLRRSTQQHDTVLLLLNTLLPASFYTTAQHSPAINPTSANARTS